MEAAEESPEDEEGNATASASTFAVIFYVISALFVVIGFIVAYQDSNYANKVVGGDAYNFIIFAGRGVAWMGAAIVFSVLGLACQVASSVAAIEEAIAAAPASSAAT